MRAATSCQKLAAIPQAVAAIDQHSKFHLSGTAKIRDGIQCRSDCSSGVEHVVHQHNYLVGYSALRD
jgi:hypothetical protein